MAKKRVLTGLKTWRGLSYQSKRLIVSNLINRNPEAGWLAGFDRYASENFKLFVIFAGQVAERYESGETRIGAKHVIEDIRRNVKSLPRVSESRQYKIDNTRVSDFARLVVLIFPELAGVIEIRRRPESRSVA
jgi:hypothetical protein